MIENFLLHPTTVFSLQENVMSLITLDWTLDTLNPFPGLVYSPAADCVPI